MSRIEEALPYPHISQWTPRLQSTKGQRFDQERIKTVNLCKENLQVSGKIRSQLSSERPMFLINKRNSEINFHDVTATVLVNILFIA